jgi:SAM-dependent methyltransferase
MKRNERILKHINKQQRGIEVGGWFAPIASKAEGYNCLTLDVFDQQALIERAKADPQIDNAHIPRIQPVDLLGTSTEIENLVAARNELGQFDYIVSSHNFEHLPNPIKFLQGCGKALRTGGVLSMAIPDRRVCFDFYRSGTSLSQWIEAFMDNRVKPTQAQIFDHNSMTARHEKRRPYESPLVGDIEASFAAWIRNAKEAEASYQDAHCWTFTPTSFELLVRDAHFLNLSPFTVLEISSRTKWNEFFVHLTNTGYNQEARQPIKAQEHQAVRQRLVSRSVQDPNYLMSFKNRLRSIF